MTKNATLFTALLLVCAVGFLHHLAISLSLYWTFWWADVVMHFLAGLALGFASFWGLFQSGIIFRSQRGAGFMIGSVFLSVFVIGAGWEVFEYMNGFTDSQEGYVQDTVNDLILDSCGALLAALVASRKKRHV